MFLAEVAVLGLGPVPVSVKSLIVLSSRLGESRDGRLAMLDFGESRTLVFDTERENRDIKLALPWCILSSGTTCVRGVFGEGVRGARPPARRVEKIPSRRCLTGVSTDGVAISAYENAFGGDVPVLQDVSPMARVIGLLEDSQMAQLRDPLVYFANICAVCRRWVCFAKPKG